MWQRIICSLGILLFPTVVVAATERFLDTPSSPDPIESAFPADTEVIYAVLADRPHSHQFTLTEPATVMMQLRLPANELGNPNTRLLLVQSKERGGVTEVWRTQPADLGWSTSTVWAEGRSYVYSDVFTQELAAGTYRLEVSSPRNEGRYVLQLGDTSYSWLTNWLNGWGTLYAQHRFAGGSPWTFVFVPALLLQLVLLAAVLAGGIRYWRQITRGK